LISVKVNRADRTTDLYLQVAAEIRRAIADGEAKPGERLPPARDLATVLGVNTNTVLRSLRLLQDEGLLELRRRRGITVSGTARARRLRRRQQGAGSRRVARPAELRVVLPGAGVPDPAHL
jgi:DNA-binding transcriptional regulator YhcF (GntR family)